MNTFFRILNTLLLAAILAVLVQIRQYMPRAIGEWEPVSVKIENTPLSVKVDNVPLLVEVDGTPQVEIVR